ncbi:MAG: hypothetical protein ACFFBI_08640 [Promethearchaeota archaeon]
MGKTFGIISLLLGIGAFVVFLMFLLGVLLLITQILFAGMDIVIIALGGVAIVFGIIGMVKDDSKALGVVGLILGIVSIVLIFVVPMIIIGAAISMYL